MNQDIHADLELYAAGALPPEEMVRYDRHLETCGVCAARVGPALAAVANLVPDTPAPTDVWVRIGHVLDGLA